MVGDSKHIRKYLNCPPRKARVLKVTIEENPNEELIKQKLIEIDRLSGADGLWPLH